MRIRDRARDPIRDRVTNIVVGYLVPLTLGAFIFLDLLRLRRFVRFDPDLIGAGPRKQDDRVGRIIIKSSRYIMSSHAKIVEKYLPSRRPFRLMPIGSSDVICPSVTCGAMNFSEYSL